jgi:2-succinyl-5-enolpyruvyl-6-hydroxy-3-cyclohexene-1-carboxylate synthase
MDSLHEAQKKLFQPELLITFGGPVTSKKLKTYLRKFKPQEHWHISISSSHTDTFQSLTHVLEVDEIYLFSLLSGLKSKEKNSYGKDLKEVSIKAHQILKSYCNKTAFSDLKAMDIIWSNIPKNSDLHLGNSAPIRYANLFQTNGKDGINYYSNRGVSGIDGMTSTASGAAYGTDKVVTLLTGDLGFFYDSNALWNKHLCDNLRIIIINNRGGGIFRLIDSKDTALLEKYFEAKHSMKAEGLVKANDIPYYSAKNESELKQSLNKLYEDHNGRPAVLEIFTPNELNAQVLSGYYNLLKK